MITHVSIRRIINEIMNLLVYYMPEILIPINIRKLEEGTYLATSDVIQGLIAEGRTIAETMEIAQDVARKLIESCIEHGDNLPEGILLDNFNNSQISIPVELQA